MEKKKRSEAGVVVSDKMKNAVVVLLPRLKKHPLYKKTTSRTKKVKALNLIGATVGQKVMIVETRPISKEIHFSVDSIAGQPKGEGGKGQK